MAVTDWESKLQNYCEKIGASHSGISSLAEPLTWLKYENWISQDFAGEMDYLKKHAPLKKQPSLWRPTFKSALIFAFPYVKHPEPNGILNSTRLALYARGFDYHHWLKARLAKVAEDLAILYPEEFFEIHTDSSPILERDLGYRAGLGWFGKNTCLIHPQKGSLFLIGEILTSLNFETKSSPLPDFCGKCQKCMEACPTGALVSPQVLDATKCVSYLTIESKKTPPENLRKQMGDWFFGCDICQTVCPWNQKVFKNQLVTAQILDLSEKESLALETDIRWLLQSSHRQILKKVKGTPLHRASAKGLKRNALVVIGNRNLISLKNEVQKLLPDSYLGELAQWTLNELSQA
jgi:epoxyqueuosine reductase